jgi:integrase
MHELQRVVRRPDIESAAADLIKSRRTQNTRDAYTLDFTRWITFCYARAIDPGLPSLVNAIEFRESLHELAPASVQRVLGTLSSLYGAFISYGLVRINPFDRKLLPRPEITSAGRTALVSDDSALRMIEVTRADHSARGRRDTALLQLLYDTGLRRSSVISMRWDALIQESGKWIATVFVKGGADERMAFTEACAEALARWRPSSSPLFVFPHRNGVEPMNLTTVNKILTARAREAGVPHVHPHSFRASYITTAYDAQIYEHEIQGSAHHKSADTTRRYDRRSRGESVADAVSQFRQAKLKEKE